MDKQKRELGIGDIVWLKPSAAGYPMMTDPENELGVGLVLEHGTEEFANSRVGMVRVLWTRSNTKRWEFIEDLVIVKHK